MEAFITDLLNLAEHCNFGSLREELIRGRIVVSIRDKNLSEKLQLGSDLSLEKAVNVVRQRETVRKQQEFLNAEEKFIGYVKKMKGKPVRQESQKTKKDDQSKHSHSGKCGRCLGPKHAVKDCPAKESDCRKCGKKGHWKRACRSKNVHEVISGEIVPNDLFLAEMSIENVESHPWKAMLRINGRDFKFKLDFGADVTVIPPGIFKQISDSEKLESTKKVLLGPCNYRLKCLGKFKAKLKSKGHCIVEDVYVVEALNRPLLGKTACASLNLLNRCKSDNVQSIQTDCVKVYEDSYKQAIIRQYPKVFEGLGEIEGKYEIKLKLKAEAYASNVPRKVPFPMLEKTKQEIDRMLQMGVISKIDQPSEWCAPMVVIPKLNGNVRICVDLTKLNENNIKRGISFAIC